MERQDFDWNALQVRELQRYSNGSRAGMASNARDNSGCHQFRRASEVSRREELRIGGLVGFGLSLPELLAQRAAGQERGGSLAAVRSQAGAWDRERGTFG